MSSHRRGHWCELSHHTYQKIHRVPKPPESLNLQEKEGNGVYIFLSHYLKFTQEKKSVEIISSTHKLFVSTNPSFFSFFFSPLQSPVSIKPVCKQADSEVKSSIDLERTGMPHGEYSGKTDVAKCCVVGRWLLGEHSRGLTIIQRCRLPWDTELATSAFMPAGSLELNKWPGNGCIRF